MKIFVSGSFDPLHSGHIQFFKTAKSFGDVYVGIGTDESIEKHKGHKTFYSQAERIFMIDAIKYVSGVNVNFGDGFLDFAENPLFLNADALLVNEEQNMPEKAALCEKLGKRYIILKRKPARGLPTRTGTELRQSWDKSQ